MAISSLSALNSLGPYGAANQSFTTSASQFQASFEKTLIDITTSEGDTVTLQRSTSHTALSQTSQWQNSDSQGLAFHGQIFDSHSFSYTVQGDLSAEELADLGELFDELSFIADDFFQGNLEAAMAGALEIGGLGSLSSLSASFSKTEISASLSTISRHPYGQADHARATSDENALARQRQAQWQQILAYLEKREQEQPGFDTKEAPPLKDHGQQMQARIDKAMERHQRLSHLIDKLAAKAISDRHQEHKERGSVHGPSPSTTNQQGHGPEKMIAGSERA